MTCYLLRGRSLLFSKMDNPTDWRKCDSKGLHERHRQSVAGGALEHRREHTYSQLAKDDTVAKLGKTNHRSVPWLCGLCTHNFGM